MAGVDAFAEVEGVRTPHRSSYFLKLSSTPTQNHRTNAGRFLGAVGADNRLRVALPTAEYPITVLQDKGDVSPVAAVPVDVVRVTTIPFFDANHPVWVAV